LRKEGKKEVVWYIKVSAYTWFKKESYHIWCIVRNLTLFLHKRLFTWLELVTWQQLYRCVKASHLWELRWYFFF